MGRTTAGAEPAVRAVERACAAAIGADDLLERVSAEVRFLVPHDGATWFGVDPATLVAAAPTRVEGFYGEYCDPFWHREYHEHDANLFVDLARGDTMAVALRQVLGSGVGKSGRFREIMKPHGYDDELRGVLRAGGSAWGFFGLYRESGRPAFDAGDVATMAAVAPLVGVALRDRMRQHSSWTSMHRAPGLLMFDEHSQVVSANSEALGWLSELLAESRETTDSFDLIAAEDHLRGVTTPLYALVARARAQQEGLVRGPARLRLLDRRGRWLVLHASCLSGRTAAHEGGVAVVIEPAKSAEVAPIIIEAYSLTPRERDVLGALARGGTTSEIAAQLFLSPHTVRDHIKTVFEKVGVSSRAELVAKLYAEHYHDSHQEHVVSVY